MIARSRPSAMKRREIVLGPAADTAPRDDLQRANRRPDIMMRFGYGAALPFSARRPVEAVLA